MPTVNETGGIFEIFQFVNNSTGGLFFPVILLVIWLIAFIGSIAEGRQVARAWIFSSFICTVLGSFLVLLDFLNKTYLFFLLLNLAFGIAWEYLSNSRND